MRSYSILRSIRPLFSRNFKMDTKTDSKMDASSSAPYYEHLLPDCQKLFGTAHPKSIEHHVFTSELLMNKRLLDTDILEPRIRIPAYIEPLHYDLAIQPDFENLTFKGLVKIHYDTRGEDYKFKYFYLHMVDLVIEKGYVEDESNEITNIRRAFYDRQNEVCLLETLSLMPGKGTLSLLFRGNLNDKLKGFYRTSYKVGDKEYLAGSTQFEATDARRCFPCVDEPNAKATFSLTILFKNDVIDLGDRKIERIAISNTPIAEIDNNPKFKEKGLSVVVFQKTPRMSTYLLAFAVGHFDHIEAHDGLRPIRVYTTPGKSEQGKFALDVACKSLRYFEKYFGIEYPLPKMDLIAVPDFASGAMENWGLVTYRETCILVDSESSTTARKQWVALVVAHELAHQWFGNLVTMEWWTDLWLKEGFATFMEYLCVDEIFPEYDIWSQFVYDCHSRALELDSLQSSHPIQVDVMLASEVDEIFDDISYNKGASLIRMMYNYIGDEHFRNGMKAYLNEHAYKNASTSDLWRALGAASEKPISALMSKWTMEAGYPFISVKLSPDQDSVLKLEQLTFSSEALFYTRKSKWMIPIYLTTEQDPKNVISKGLLPEPSMDITVDGVKEKWVKMNPGAIGLYRTYYPDEILQRLTRAIRDKTLPPVDRFNIVNDYFALCKAGHVDSSRLLNLLKAYDCEDEYIVWCSIDECISHISTLLAYTDFQSLFYTYGIKLYSKILERLTWSPLDGEKHTDKMTRALVINRMVAFGEPSVVAEAQRKYNAHVSGEEVMPADLRGAVYIAVAKSGDDASFDSLYDLHKEVQLQEEKNRIARALGFAKVGPRLDRVVEFVMSDQVRNQDKDAVVASISINCPLVAWKLFTDHHEWFREKYESGSLMSRLVKCATHNFASIEQATTIQKFFENHNLPGTSKAVMQSVEQIHRNARWLSSEADAIKTFLQTD